MRTAVSPSASCERDARPVLRRGKGHAPLHGLDGRGTLALIQRRQVPLTALPADGPEPVLRRRTMAMRVPTFHWGTTSLVPSERPQCQHEFFMAGASRARNGATDRRCARDRSEPGALPSSVSRDTPATMRGTIMAPGSPEAAPSSTPTPRSPETRPRAGIIKGVCDPPTRRPPAAPLRSRPSS
jgi:hypothetical protein